MPAFPLPQHRVLFRLLSLFGVLGALATAPPALAQATSRPCEPGSASEANAGPACLMAHLDVGTLAGDSVYWIIDSYPDLSAAQRSRSGRDAVVEAFGKTWRFSLAATPAPSPSGQRMAAVGPIPIDKAVRYDAEFLKSVFSPGMTAPLHVHSGPEAFYAVSGDTCLETPDGVQQGRGPGNTVIVRAGPPMLLMANGPNARLGFALILHDHMQPPTTLTQHWQPKGLCKMAPGVPTPALMQEAHH